MSFEPKKLYYKIGEVCQIVEVEPYVLRYWETEFPSLQPRKSKGRQRLYRPSDIELLLKIRKLLYEDGFTIAGARRKLAASRPGAVAGKGAKAAERPAAAGPAPEPSENISRVRRELESILTLLDGE
jgi:DNA-binding transcriptional MerR regulator